MNTKVTKESLLSMKAGQLVHATLGDLIKLVKTHSLEDKEGVKHGALSQYGFSKAGIADLYARSHELHLSALIDGSLLVEGGNAKTAIEVCKYLKNSNSKTIKLVTSSGESDGEVSPEKILDSILNQQVILTKTDKDLSNTKYRSMGVSHDVKAQQQAVKMQGYANVETAESAFLTKMYEYSAFFGGLTREDGKVKPASLNALVLCLGLFVDMKDSFKQDKDQSPQDVSAYMQGIYKLGLSSLKVGQFSALIHHLELLGGESGTLMDWNRMSGFPTENGVKFSQLKMLLSLRYAFISSEFELDMCSGALSNHLDNVAALRSDDKEQVSLAFAEQWKLAPVYIKEMKPEPVVEELLEAAKQQTSSKSIEQINQEMIELVYLEAQAA